ncbi:putative F-box protein [Camellia lanceoleosa]|uniref:F-box protein n=1 Tax=Camellia lanceoleosa TaxID=1840588 RepID=A0ACC0GQZ9_9ERIC|nr:putative F-box protein [Camellia lanceoleosa]
MTNTTPLSMAIESVLNERELERVKKSQKSAVPAKENSQPWLPNLSKEIIEDEILSRLPGKSLLQFRCVSKSWRSSISNPQFVKTHLGMSSRTDNDYIQQRLILRYIHEFDLKS